MSGEAGPDGAPTSEHVERQRDFYDSRPHRGLQPRGGDRYVEKLTATVVERLGIGPQHRVLEIGAGFGRFTFALLEHCSSVTALDLSQQALATLSAQCEERGVAPERCRTVHGDLDRVDLERVGAHDFVLGFFVLHHLEDVSASLHRLGAFVSPGGALAFLEPNRWNPLYALQVACCPDMTWREERGVWTLNPRTVMQAYRGSGLAAQPVHRFGFFPPQLINRFEWARQLEHRLERQRWLSGVLPFQLLAGCAAAPDGDAAR